MSAPTKDPLTDMRTDFEGYCSKCKKTLPMGAPRKFHRFSRQILCHDCVAPKAGPVKTSRSSSIDGAQLDRIEYMLKLICSKLHISIDPPGQPVEEEAPKRPTAEEFVERFVQMSQTWREHTPSFTIVDDQTVDLGECSFMHFHDVKSELAKWGFRKGRVEVLDGGRLKRMELDV